MEIVKTEVTLLMRPTDQKEKLAFILDNVLSKDECEVLIKGTEEAGYEDDMSLQKKFTLAKEVYYDHTS